MMHLSMIVVESFGRFPQIIILRRVVNSSIGIINYRFFFGINHLFTKINHVVPLRPISRWVTHIDRIVEAVCELIITKNITTNTCYLPVCIQIPTNFRVIISTIQVIESRLGIIPYNIDNLITISIPINTKSRIKFLTRCYTKTFQQEISMKRKLKI